MVNTFTLSIIKYIRPHYDVLLGRRKDSLLVGSFDVVSIGFILISNKAELFHYSEGDNAHWCVMLLDSVCVCGGGG